tara:strand:+ start:2557 stop:2823 length:267 start_codon:yes stop_codon:yes gene_type:complete
MTTKPIQQLFTDFLEMPYFKNYTASSGMVHNFAKHEEAIVSVMEKHGYTKYNPLLTTKIISLDPVFGIKFYLLWIKFYYQYVNKSKSR